ncbi:hypothetical protein QW71_04140 [Paenibacillus sp. IHB B 3415]|uniref:hypothetical protein n=1 Tax=Paenibacillus sp. IHB B 3415 TaxID=867080 RepID=UPI0005753C1B|nr:hypothetical protein [Paenibacillus sp. IHB B 3415]KHL96831.1 hypothetical protein QW71_04140 [Paenibacillus sp. IHB B 3415]
MVFRRWSFNAANIAAFVLGAGLYAFKNQMLEVFHKAGAFAGSQIFDGKLKDSNKCRLLQTLSILFLVLSMLE